MNKLFEPPEYKKNRINIGEFKIFILTENMLPMKGKESERNGMQ